MSKGGGPVFITLRREDSNPGDGTVNIHLRRKNTSTPWGFRIQGGRDQGVCLHIQKVTARSIAERRGMRPGDGILKIGHEPAVYLDHQQAKMEIIRAGNELDFCVQRNAVTTGIDRSNETQRSNSPVDEATTFKGFINPNVQSRSFRRISDSLFTEAPEAAD
ncbi:PDZ and LIM domain protein 2-like isoform X2 [Gigantopelta aegis]|uniref:PDZ and LIM domain protein 2-like isoform X2 n=1 Tax=Gigantopelta aegis TaxID=1735272 RepID=UPI001B88D4E6|nr:PDZ and LIM domain protein 2-like isoform X2 [Gigantopelta aegis]